MSQPATNGSEEAEEGEAPEVKWGRPSCYSQDMVRTAAKLAELGATDAEIAQTLRIAISTFYKWKAEKPDFSEAVQRNKALFDDRVEQSMAQRAIGFEYTEERAFFPAGAKEPVIVPITKYFTGSDQAAMNWLTNRRPDKWRNRQELSLQGDSALQQVSTEDLEQAWLDRMKDVTPKAVTHEDE